MHLARRRLIVLVFFALTAMVGYPASLQGTTESGKKQPRDKQERRAFRAGRVIPIDGEERSPGVLLVKDGRIEKLLGGEEELGDGVEIVELGSDAVVLPVLINPLSQIHELGSSLESRRSGVIGGRITARLADGRKRKAAEEVDARHKVYARLAKTGYGAVALTPDNGRFISGRAAVVVPKKSDTKEDLILVEDGYLYMAYSLGKNWRTRVERDFKKAIETAKKIRQAREGKTEEKKKPVAEAKNGTQGNAEKAGGTDNKKTPEKDTKKQVGPPPPEKGTAGPPKAKETKPPPTQSDDPLVQVFLGERTAFLMAETPAVIDHCVRVLDKLPERLHFVLVTGPQELDTVKKLAERGDQIRGVILEPRLSTIQDTSIYLNAARTFDEQNLAVAFVPMSDDIVGHETIFYYLAEMVKSGMSPARALRAVTLTPARLLGLDDRMGSLRPGRVASFVVFERDPLSGAAAVKSVYYEGVKVFPAPSAEERSLGGEVSR